MIKAFQSTVRNLPSNYNSQSDMKTLVIFCLAVAAVSAHVPSGWVGVGKNGAVIAGPAGSVRTDNGLHGHGAGAQLSGPAGDVRTRKGHVELDGPGMGHGHGGWGNDGGNWGGDGGNWGGNGGNGGNGGMGWGHGIDVVVVPNHHGDGGWGNGGGMGGGCGGGNCGGWGHHVSGIPVEHVGHHHGW